MAKVVLLDGPNLAVRSFHAAKAMGGHGAVFLFINSLSRLLKDERPDRFLVCWDAGSDYRRRLYPAYKANRSGSPNGLSGIDRSYIGDILTFLDLAGLPLYYDDGFEADDIIAAAHERHRAQGDHVVILSSDKDLMQLLDPHTEQVRFAAGNALTDRWDAARFLDCYGFQPAQWPLITALTGDPGDNVPGVRGLGPKKALRLLQAADWDLGAALAFATPEQHDAARLSLALVDLRRVELVLPIDVPVFAPTDRRSEPQWAALMTFCHDRQMSTVVKRLEEGLLWPLPC